MKTLYVAVLMAISTIHASERAQLQPLISDARTSARIAQQQFERQSVYQHGLELIVPELIIGGEWTSTIKLINKGTTTIPWSNVHFMDDSGNPMKATYQTTGGSITTDYGFSFKLGPASGILEVTFYGGKDTNFGNALIDPDACPSSGCQFYGEVTLRNRSAGRPDFESVFPLEEPSDVQHLLWDNRSGYSTVLYLVSDSSTANVSIA